MKKIIISSIATITLIVGGVMLIPLNQPSNHVEDTPKQHLEAQQSVIEHETVIDAPEEVEAAVEAPKVQIENKVVEPIEAEVIVREPTFEELVVKYNISGDSRIGKLKDLFDNRTRTAPAEDRFLLFMSRLGFDMTESHSIYDRDEAYSIWAETLKNNQGF